MNDPIVEKVKFIEEARQLCVGINDKDIETIISIFWGYIVVNRLIPKVIPKCETDLEWSMSLVIDFLNEHKSVIKRILNGEDVDWC